MFRKQKIEKVPQAMKVETDLYFRYKSENTKQGNLQTVTSDINIDTIDYNFLPARVCE